MTDALAEPGSPTQLPRELNTHELAWAAGFFDGEGHSRAQMPRRNGRNATATFAMSVHQVERATLERFQRAVLGLGRIYEEPPRPPHQRVYQWQTTNWRDAQAVQAMLWKFLSPPKRAQIRNAIAKFRSVENWGLRVGWHPNTRAALAKLTAPHSHCFKGHPLEDPNLVYTKSGQRHCRTCRNERNRASYARTRAS